MIIHEEMEVQSDKPSAVGFILGATKPSYLITSRLAVGWLAWGS